MNKLTFIIWEGDTTDYKTHGRIYVVVGYDDMLDCPIFIGDNGKLYNAIEHGWSYYKED